MIDPRSPVLELTIDNRDFTLKQSPGALGSSRAGGTTGAAVWRIAPDLARWISSDANVLFRLGILRPDACVLELGAGVAAVVPLMLSPKIARYLATDQSYSLKLLEENIAANTKSSLKHTSKAKSHAGKSKAPSIEVLSLDWETHDVQSLLKDVGLESGVDLVLASDCVYNYALIKPFVQTCVDACRLRENSERPSICLVAQQLRQPDVFEEWLTLFMECFDTWRLLEKSDTPFGSGSPYVLHVGILKATNSA